MKTLLLIATLSFASLTFAGQVDQKKCEAFAESNKRESKVIKASDVKTEAKTEAVIRK